MHVQFQTEGGLAHFPGLSRPLILDSSEMPPEEASRLEQLVHAARLFDLPERVTPTAALPGRADYRSYTITADELERSHTVRVDEPISDPPLKALVDHLRALPRR